MVKHISPNGQTALMHACQNNKIDVVKFILENGGEELINNLNDSNQNALSITTQGGTTQIVNLLKQKGALLPDIIKLQNTLKQNEESTKIDFSQDTVTPEGVKLILEFLKTHEKVKEVNFGKTTLKVEDEKLITSLVNENIKKPLLKEIMEKIAEGNDRIAGGGRRKPYCYTNHLK